MKVFKIILVLMFLVNTAGTFLTEIETKILFFMIRKTNIRNLVLAPEERLGRAHLNLFKEFSKESQCFTVIIKRENLKRYIEKIDPNSYAWTIVTFKTTNTSLDNYIVREEILCSYFWVIYDDLNGTSIEQLMKHYVPINCAMLVIQKVSETYYKIKEYYNIKKGSRGIVNEIGEWKNDKLLLSDVEWYDRKSDLKGFNFTTIKLKEDFYISPRIKANEEIWEELAVLLNFTVSMKLIEYGFERPVNETEGDEEEEAFLDPQIYIKNEKKDKFLLGPTAQSKVYLHVKVLGENTGFTRIIKPFSNNLWISTSVWLTLLALVAISFEYVRQKLRRQRKDSNKMILMIFIPFYSLCSQSGLKDDKQFASFFLLFVTRISSFVLYCAYGATLLSYLLLYIPKLPFTDLEGFVKDGTHKIEGERNSDVDIFFNVSQNPLERLVYEKFMSDPKTWSRFDKGIDRMCSGEKLVLIGYDNDIDRYTPCPVVKIRKPLKIFASGFQIRPRSPFKELLQIKLMLMQTTGILKRINRKIFFGNFRSSQMNNRHKNYDIKLSKVVPIFILFTWGTLLSVMIVIIEIITWNIKKRNRNESETRDEYFTKTTNFSKVRPISGSKRNLSRNLRLNMFDNWPSRDCVFDSQLKESIP